MSSVGGVGGSDFNSPVTDEVLERIQSSKERGPSISDYWEFMQAMTGLTLHNMFAIRQFDAAYHIGNIDGIKATSDYWKAIIEGLEAHKQLFYSTQETDYDESVTTPTNETIVTYNTHINNDYEYYKNFIRGHWGGEDGIHAQVPGLQYPPNIEDLESLIPIADDEPYDEEALLKKLQVNFDIVERNNQKIAALNAWTNNYNSQVSSLRSNWETDPQWPYLPTLSPLDEPPTEFDEYDPSTFPDIDKLDTLQAPETHTLEVLNEEATQKATSTRAAAIMETLRRLLRRAPGQHSDVKGADTVAPGSGSLTQAAQLPTADIDAVFGAEQNKMIAMAITRLFIAQEPSIRDKPSVAEIVSLVKANLVAILDYLNPQANLDAIAVAGGILGPNIALDDPALKFFTALSHLEQAIGLIGSQTIATLFAQQDLVAALPESLRSEVTALLTSAVALPLLSIAFTQIGILLNDIKPLNNILTSLYKAAQKKPEKPIDDLAKGLEGPLAEQLAAAIAAEFKGRLNDKQQEALTQRIITELLGPTLLTIKPATLGLTEEEKEIVREEVTSPSARKEAAFKAKEEEKSTVLPSAVQLFFDNLNVVLEHTKIVDKQLAVEIEKNFREAPTIRLTEDLSPFFIRKLLPLFQFEHTPGGVMYTDFKDPNLPPPDVLFRG